MTLKRWACSLLWLGIRISLLKTMRKRGAERCSISSMIFCPALTRPTRAITRWVIFRRRCLTVRVMPTVHCAALLNRLLPIALERARTLAELRTEQVSAQA